MSNQNYWENAANLAAKSVAMQRNLAQKAFDNAASLRRSVLNTVNPAEAEVEDKAIIGHWLFESVKIPGIGLSRNSTEMDNYYFELFPDGKAIACIHGDTYETTYSVTEGCISFSNMELSAMKLSMYDGKLCMHNYLGTTITFTRCERK